jgi:ankyrin repeat protein/ABC-type molybdate transport system substrate-binding protein
MPVLLALLLLAARPASADELRVMTSGAFTAAYLELAPAFERATGVHVVTEATSIGSGPTGIAARLERGEAIDVVIVADRDFEQLMRAGRIRAGTRVDLARSAIGMAVRHGAAKPDIGSIDALRQTLLRASSIAYSASVSGTYLSTELFQRLGVADQVLPKSRRIETERVGAVVARGDAEIGFQQISELLPIAGIDVVGPLPSEVQRVTVVAAGVGAAAPNPALATRFIAFLASPAAADVIRKAALEPVAAAQPRSPDFAAEIQPLLREKCVGCHGPTQQMSGYRLDRRSAAFRGLLRPNIIPGSSASSRLYHRISGIQFGPQMPPTGALAPEQIERIRAWIDAGAEWPDALANETERPAADPAAVRLVDAIRRGSSSMAHAPMEARVLNARAEGGTTPVMAAALYGNAALLESLLDAGGDPDARNDVGATPLMWALDDLAKVRVLVERGADVDAASDFGRTPLALAASQFGGLPVVKLLLEYGATPSAEALASAAFRGDAETVRVLCAAGVRDTAPGATAALRSGCRECFDAIAAVRPLPQIGNALATLLPPIAGGRIESIRTAVDHGADVRAVDQKGRSALMTAAASDTLPPESLQFLIDRGAEVNAANPDGETALDFARRRGRTPAVEVLLHAGAVAKPEPDVDRPRVRANTIRAAVERSVPLLQRIAPQFYDRSGCVSCHNNTLTAMTVAAARAQGFAVDERLAAKEAATLTKDVEEMREHALQQIVVPGGGATTTGSILMALHAQGYGRTAGTDALVRLLALGQRSDGRWPSVYRPPSEASEFTATAVSVRGIALYAPPDRRAQYASTIDRAVAWLTTSGPVTTEDRVFRLFGLVWGSARREIVQAARADLVKMQRADGGWGQLPSMPSDAYATGEALAALHDAGLETSDPVYRRGVRYLLSTQLEDGSWYVRTRAHTTQAFFDSGFPHGRDQYISAAATNWAAMTLALAAR